MERHYGPEWAAEEKVKRRELVTPEARYIFVYEASSNEEKVILEGEHSLVGFVHYRFTLEEEMPVLYVYEIQLESRAQGKGLGKFLMQLLELIARKVFNAAFFFCFVFFCVINIQSLLRNRAVLLSDSLFCRTA